MDPVKHLTFGSLQIKIFESRALAGKCAAEEGAAVIRSLLSKRDTINIVFAAAPSQDDTLRELILQEGIDWSRVRAFHMDEYLGLEIGHEQSFGTYLDKHIWSRLPFKEIHYFNGAASDSDKECERYADLIRLYPPDLIFLGIGENGHIAFNDPWVADFKDRSLVKVVQLDEVCRMQQVNDGCFEKIDDVPTHAYTLTIPALLQAEYLFCTVPGPTKAGAVYRTANEGISEDCPATIMRNHLNAYMYCDAESGKELL